MDAISPTCFFGLHFYSRINLSYIIADITKEKKEERKGRREKRETMFEEHLERRFPKFDTINKYSVFPYQIFLSYLL